MVARSNEKKVIEKILYDKLEKQYRGDIGRPFSWKGLMWESCLIGNIINLVLMCIGNASIKNKKNHFRFHCICDSLSYHQFGNVFQSLSLFCT